MEDQALELMIKALVAPKVNNLPAMQEIRVWSLDWKHHLEKGVAAHSSILAWRILWTEEPGCLQSMGLQRVGHDWCLCFWDETKEDFSEGLDSHNEIIPFWVLNSCPVNYKFSTITAGDTIHSWPMWELWPLWLAISATSGSFHSHILSLVLN